MLEETEFPEHTFNSVKLEEGAKGVRITVHLYSNYTTLAKEAVELYLKVKKECEKHDIVVSPMEIKVG